LILRMAAGLRQQYRIVFAGGARRTLGMHADGQDHAALCERTGRKVREQFEMIQIEPIVFARREGKDADDKTVNVLAFVGEIDDGDPRAVAELRKRAML